MGFEFDVSVAFHVISIEICFHKRTEMAFSERRVDFSIVKTEENTRHAMTRDECVLSPRVSGFKKRCSRFVRATLAYALKTKKPAQTQPASTARKTRKTRDPRQRNPFSLVSVTISTVNDDDDDDLLAARDERGAGVRMDRHGGGPL